MLALGRKVMTNLDSILKSRDISLPTKVRLVKAMVFLPRSKHLLISRLQATSAVILENKIKPFTVSTVSPSICHGTGSNGTGCHGLGFLNVEF